MNEQQPTTPEETTPAPAAPAPAAGPAVEQASPEAALAVTLESAPETAAGSAGAAEPAGGGDKVVELSPAECGAKLAELFPALFVPPGAPGPVKAIKLRIHADIQARVPGMFGKRTLGVFFSRYTTSNAYLKALVAPGAQRFDLDGQPAGEIAEEHRAAAVEELARRHAIAAERRAAQRRAAAPAGREAAPARREGRAAASANAASAQGQTGEGGPSPMALPRRGERRDEAELDRPPRGARSPHRENRGPRPLRPEGRAHGDPRAHAPRDSRSASAARGPKADAPWRSPASPSPSPADTETATPMPGDPAQRERALLLRAFETSTLSKANFCALKRMTEADLDAALAQAREERQSRARLSVNRP